MPASTAQTPSINANLYHPQRPKYSRCSMSIVVVHHDDDLDDDARDWEVFVAG
jgi:hypothetical protein